MHPGVSITDGHNPFRLAVGGGYAEPPESTQRCDQDVRCNQGEQHRQDDDSESTRKPDRNRLLMHES
jgi:hypothetical protein